MMRVFFNFFVVFLTINLSEECALPYWWTQQYHFPPDFRVSGQPKTTYRYRETFHRSDPNNYVHFQEYSEYTWWEHDSSKTKETKLTPEDIRQMTNVIFSKDGSINGIIPGKTRGMLPRADGANGMIPRRDDTSEILSRSMNTKGIFPSIIGDSGEIFPRGDSTNGMIPRGSSDNGIMQREGDTNGMIPREGGTNGMIPREGGTNGMFPREGGTNGMIPRGSDTGGIIPREGDINAIMNREGDNNGMIPRGENSNGMVPTTVDMNEISPVGEDSHRMIPNEANSNGIVPSDGMMPDLNVEKTTTETTRERETDSSERERNESEDVEITNSGGLERNDIETSGASKSSSELKVKEPNSRGRFFGSWFGHRIGNETEPCKVSETDIHSLRSMIEKMFSAPREHLMHAESKEKAREDILNKFRNYGLQVWTQNFTTPPMKNPNGTEEYNEGVNLVGVIPGSQRGRLDDEIVLVGAHYDTVADSNGVDDNGSGLAVMLEVARAITEARCRLNHTLMFVAFDHEENGAMGSNYFVDHYLIPEELKRARARFQGAFILDGIMNYNDIPNTQELPMDYAQSLPGFQYFVNNTGNRGNFLAMISRNEMDNHLSKKLMDAWQELGEHQYKLFNLAVDMGNSIPDPSVLQKHLNFLRSDHATFWYHNSSSHYPESLNAVLLTDTGPFRGQMKECYHSKCDDLTVINPEKLQFAKKTADALTATLVELTSATAAGSQIQASWITFAFHVIAIYYITKILRSM